MPHADSSVLPAAIVSKADLWEHIHAQLEHLVEGQRNWVSNLANASSLIYSTLLAFTPDFGDADRAVNWCGNAFRPEQVRRCMLMHTKGFYLDTSLFPSPQYTRTQNVQGESHGGVQLSRLLLGPFCGKPACQFIETNPAKARGVCADAYLQRKTVLVPDVDAYPGHIACDGDTKSELVCPLVLADRVIGVLDLDCLALGGFEDVDSKGVEKIAGLLVGACDW